MFRRETRGRLLHEVEFRSCRTDHSGRYQHAALRIFAQHQTGAAKPIEVWADRSAARSDAVGEAGSLSRVAAHVYPRKVARTDRRWSAEQACGSQRFIREFKGRQREQAYW